MRMARLAGVVCRPTRTRKPAPMLAARVARTRRPPAMPAVAFPWRCPRQCAALPVAVRPPETDQPRYRPGIGRGSRRGRDPRRAVVVVARRNPRNLRWLGKLGPARPAVGVRPERRPSPHRCCQGWSGMRWSRRAAPVYLVHSCFWFCGWGFGRRHWRGCRRQIGSFIGGFYLILATILQTGIEVAA